MKVGDLVRPRSYQYRDQIGIIIVVGFVGAIGVRLLCGRVVTYNRGSLEVLSEGR